MGERLYFVYIMTNLHMTTLYTGITNNLLRRVDEHKRGAGGAFSRKYHLNRLVYYEIYRDVWAAISREKRIKGGSRSRKIELINFLNPKWLDLSLDMDQ